MEATQRRPFGRVDLVLALALVAAAVALRAWHVAWGLPDFTEEAIPLQLSFAMRSVTSGAIDPNPHAFSYPSLGIDLHLLVQQCVFLLGRLRGAWSNAADYQLAFYLDPTPMVLAARALGIAADALAVLAVFRLARRWSRTAGVLAALLLVGSVTGILTARSIYVDSIMTCLALWALERMLAWQAEGGRGRFAAAALLVGLAAGTKYPAAVLLLPLGALALAREGGRGLRLVAVGTLVAALAFVLTTPWVLLDTGAFLRDFRFEGHHAAEGHLGSEGHLSFGFHLGHLVRDLGWPAVVLLVLSPLAAWREPRRRPVTLALWLALLAFGLPIALARIDAERYLLPVLAAAAPLVALAATALLARVPVRARATTTLVAMLVLVLPPLGSGALAARRGARDTQVEARAWCEAHVGDDQLVVTEGYGPRLVEESQVADLLERPAYAHASGSWRARVEALPRRHVVALPLAVAGRLVNELALPGRAPVTLEIAPHASAITNVYYTPELFTGADWFITTSAVRGRYVADPARFASPCALYRLLDAHATVAARFAPDGETSGPEILVYRVDARTRAALAAHGPLDPLWWTAAIPADYRRSASRLLAGGRATPASAAADSARAATPEMRAADGSPAPWVLGLQPLYRAHLAAFAGGMAHALALLGRFEDAAGFAVANYTMMPQDVPSCLLASVALARTQRWPESRRVLEGTLAALGAQPQDPALQLQYARALAHTGEIARARALDERLLGALPADDPVATAARADLAKLQPPR